MVRLVTRSTRCSLRTARTAVSHAATGHWSKRYAYTDIDVIVLTAMGEEAAIECKESAKGS